VPSWCIFERYTDRAKAVLALAEEEARLLEHGFIGTEHVLLGLLREGEGIAARALESLGVELGEARREVQELIGPSPAVADALPYTPRTRHVFQAAVREAQQLGHEYVGTEHLLLGLVREGEGVASQVLANIGVGLSEVRRKVVDLLSGSQVRAADDEHLQLVSSGGRRSALQEPGDTWKARVVRTGRTPAVFAGAYDALAAIADRLGRDIDNLKVHVESVETEEGPGLSLSVDWVAPGDETGE
jgi:ATP-dependent Clp protease ATP-binding subunit ClpA